MMSVMSGGIKVVLGKTGGREGGKESSQQLEEHGAISPLASWELRLSLGKMTCSGL